MERLTHDAVASVYGRRVVGNAVSSRSGVEAGGYVDLTPVQRVVLRRQGQRLALLRTKHRREIIHEHVANVLSYLSSGSGAAKKPFRH